MSAIPPFHLAFPVHCLVKAREFYGTLLGCPEGRSAETWIDFNLHGHQIVAHRTKDAKAFEKEGDQGGSHNPVDGHEVPVPHFGIVLPWDDWHKLAERLKLASIDFLIEPYTRFEGQPGEQATMFFRDPSGNALEFKAFKDSAQLFAK